MEHTIDGEPAPQTVTTRDVLLQINVLQRRNLERRPPDLLRLLTRRLVVYQRERKGEDRYLTWWQVLETSGAVREWLRYRNLSWDQVAADWQRWAGELEAALMTEPAKADCEDLAAFGAASLPTWGHVLAAWPCVKEVGAWGVLAGWHAEVLILGTDRLPGEVPICRDVFVLSLNMRTPQKGERFGEWDPSYLGGMPRPDMS